MENLFCKSRIFAGNIWQSGEEKITKEIPIAYHLAGNLDLWLVYISNDITTTSLGVFIVNSMRMANR